MNELQEQPVMDIRQIVVKENRGRKNFDKDKMMELMQSVKLNGVIQPVVLTTEKIGGVDKIVLVAGERRMRASLMNGFTTIPYRWKRDLPEIEQKRIELEENIGRQDLDWPEKNELIRQIALLETKEKGTMRGDPEAFKMKDLADKIDESPALVSQRVTFAQACVDRPDIFAKVQHMGMAAAQNKFKQIVESERVQELHSEGKLKLTESFLLGDTSELIKSLGSDTVDMVLSDTPFAIPELEGDRGETQIYTQGLKQTDNLNVEQMILLVEKLAPEWFRVLKPSGHLWLFFGWDVYEFMYQSLTKAGFQVERVPIIWDKMTTTAAFKGYSPAPCFEQLLLAHKPPRTKRLNESCKGLISFKTVSRVSRTHPFEKPQDLLSWLIKQSTKLGDVVLDSFAGTASVPLAANACGRSYIAHEIDKDHFFIGQKRIMEQALKTTI